MSASGERNKECSECTGADPHRDDCLTSSEDHYLTLFEERQGIFYVQYPIDRASHIRPLMILLEHRLTEKDSRGSKPSNHFLLFLNP